MLVDINQLPDTTKAQAQVWLNCVLAGETVVFSQGTQLLGMLNKPLTSNQDKTLVDNTVQKRSYLTDFNFDLERMQQRVENQQFIEVPKLENAQAIRAWLENSLER